MTLAHRKEGDPGHIPDHNEIVDILVALPTGGVSGQVLTKSSATDYDTAWQAIGGDGISEVVVDHGPPPTDPAVLLWVDLDS